MLVASGILFAGTRRGDAAVRSPWPRILVNSVAAPSRRPRGGRRSSSSRHHHVADSRVGWIPSAWPCQDASIAGSLPCQHTGGAHRLSRRKLGTFDELASLVNLAGQCEGAGRPELSGCRAEPLGWTPTASHRSACVIDRRSRLLGLGVAHLRARAASYIQSGRRARAERFRSSCMSCASRCMGSWEGS
jgi:hypothetical protein